MKGKSASVGASEYAANTNSKASISQSQKSLSFFLSAGHRGRLARPSGLWPALPPIVSLSLSSSAQSRESAKPPPCARARTGPCVRSFPPLPMRPAECSRQPPERTNYTLSPGLISEAGAGSVCFLAAYCRPHNSGCSVVVPPNTPALKHYNPTCQTCTKQ